MSDTRPGSIHLFRVAGIDLFLHWSWFLVAAYEIGDRAKAYSSLTWNVLEYLALFLIVMLLSLATRWPAGKWAGLRTASCSGLSAAWLT